MKESNSNKNKNKNRVQRRRSLASVITEKIVKASEVPEEKRLQVAQRLLAKENPENILQSLLNDENPILRNLAIEIAVLYGKGGKEILAEMLRSSSEVDRIKAISLLSVHGKEEDLNILSQIFLSPEQPSNIRYAAFDAYCKISSKFSAPLQYIAEIVNLIKTEVEELKGKEKYESLLAEIEKLRLEMNNEINNQNLKIKEVEGKASIGATIFSSVRMWINENQEALNQNITFMQSKISSLENTVAKIQQENEIKNTKLSENIENLRNQVDAANKKVDERDKNMIQFQKTCLDSIDKRFNKVKQDIIDMIKMNISEDINRLYEKISKKPSILVSAVCAFGLLLTTTVGWFALYKRQSNMKEKIEERVVNFEAEVQRKVNEIGSSIESMRSNFIDILSKKDEKYDNLELKVLEIKKELAYLKSKTESGKIERKLNEILKRVEEMEKVVYDEEQSDLLREVYEKVNSQNEIIEKLMKRIESLEQHIKKK